MEAIARKFLVIGRKVWPYVRKGGPIVIALGIGLLLAAAWWLGPQWEIAGERSLASWQARALVTVVVVMLIILIWGTVLASRLKKVNNDKADEQQKQADPILAYERRQTRLLNRTLAALKTNIPGRNGVYRLPWYLMMGLEDAGKSSLIQRSGQTFTLTNVVKSQNTERNVRNFEWWVSDDAVLIDPDGELLSQTAKTSLESGTEKRLWEHFMRWLEENRSRRPLNGVVLTIDLAELSGLGEAERENKAIMLRSRLRELMDQIGSRLPVYISFTKMDLLHGFGAFFRKLSRAERENPLGFTFQIESLRDPDEWFDQFEAQYTQLMEQINARLPEILSETRDPEERAAIYSFTRQLAGLYPVTHQFLSQMLSADAFSTPAMVRGVYFTSVYQEGVPEDAFVGAAARHYGLSDSIQPAQRGGQSFTYFSEKLFPQVIYPEAGLAGDNVRVTRQRRRSLATAAVIFIAAGLGLTAGWQHYFLENAEAAQQVKQQVQSFVDDWHPVGQETDASGRNLLDPLDQLRDATLAFGNYRKQWRLLADMGLYQGDRIGPEVEKSYLNMLAYQFLPALMVGVMDEMNKASEQGTERLKHLRVLRMLYDAGGRRPKLVEHYMAKFWQEHYPGQRTVQKRLGEHLQYAMAYTDLGKWRDNGDQAAEMALMPFESSVQWAQRELGRLATTDRVYRDLKTRAARDLPSAMNLEQKAGPAFDSVFTRIDSDGRPLEATPSASDDPLRIPRLLTKEGLQRYFLGQTDDVTEMALVDAWVLGRRNNVDFSEADEAQLRAQLRDQYADDYARTWRQALSRIDVRDFQDINHGVRLLEDLSGGHEPLVQLMTTLRKNTLTFPPNPEQPEAARKVLEKSPRYRMAQDIGQQFAALTNLMRKNEDEPSQLDDIQSVIRNLHDYLRGIQEAPNTGKAALSAARKRLTLEGADPIFMLQRLADNQPAPLDRMLKKLADESWRVVLDQAVAELERKWYREVYQPFQQSLARHYPFNSGAGRDAALQDFERFFAPKGTLNTFYEKNLKIFLEDHPDSVAVSQRATLVRRDVMAAINQAKKIRKAFFTRRGSLDVEFSLEPLNLSSNKRRSVVNVDGQLVEFSHGPRQSIPLIWPNTLRDSVESRVTLVPVEVNRSPRSETSKGPWAFFRLLDKAEITGVSSSAVDVKFSLDDGSVRYRLHAAGSTNPFTQKLLANYKIPRSLY